MRQEGSKSDPTRIITNEKNEERKKHCQQVYDAILSLQNQAKTKEIEQWIDSINKLKNETLELQASWKYQRSAFLMDEEGQGRLEKTEMESYAF